MHSHYCVLALYLRKDVASEGQVKHDFASIQVEQLAKQIRAGLHIAFPLSKYPELHGHLPLTGPDRNFD